MTISAGALSWLIYLAIALVALAPVVLVVAWWRDWRGGKLW